MKLLKWAVGGAGAYAIYKYSIGRKAKGEDVFVSPEKELEKIARSSEPEAAAPAKPKAKRTAKPKSAAAKMAAKPAKE
ncbi:hypothetical protein [Novosphingobium sp. KN65.2]|uniref:hypothetical protein n=1 Tax=Novosphingobium sp. KN65.2 TaxID=1478134 RepID=UPI0005DFA4F1|nr:hypothetical protein [Novosphingobium sp. KN65.2]CDO36321.1 hypothetical protein SPHV1_2310063 [Novosphingobium sp. KN65.2]